MFASGVATVWRRDNCLRLLDERKAGEREHRDREINSIRYCFNVFSFHHSSSQLLSIVDDLHRSSATMDSSYGEFARIQVRHGTDSLRRVGRSLFGFSLPALSPLPRGRSSQILTLRLSFLVLRFAVLFEELVEQHRVHRVVAHGVDLAVVIAHHQIGIHLGYFLGDQAELRLLSCRSCSETLRA